MHAIELERCVHNEEHECAPCADARHARGHPELVEGCVLCKHLTIQLSPKVVSKKSSAPPSWQKGRNNWGGTVVTDSRGMPLLDGNGDMIRQKRYSENKAKFEEARHKLATASNPYGTEE